MSLRGTFLSRRCRLLALTALWILAGCGRTSPPPSTPSPTEVLREQLMEADRSFAAETEQRRLDGWMSFYTEDAARVVLGDSAVRGLQNIRLSDARLFDDPNLHLRWTPTDAGLFDGGQMGFTTGVSAYVRTSTGTTLVDTLSVGRYVTIWRRADDGRWMVVLDTGA